MASLTEQSYYHILGVPRDADERQIKRAYHRLARELHPDKADNPEKAKEVERSFAVVSTAYNTLKDPKLRSEYDEKYDQQRTIVNPNGRMAPNAAAATNRPSASGGIKTPSSPIDNFNVTSERIAIAQKAYAKGLALMKAKDPAKASEFFEAALSNNGNEAQYHAQLAMSLIQAKKSASRAIAAAQRAIELDTYNIDYKFNLAQIYDAIGSKTNAIKVYEEIVKWEPENQMAQQMLRGLRKTGSFMEKIAGNSPVLGYLRKKMSKSPAQRR